MMKPLFNLRPATNADCQAVQDLVFAVLAEYGLSPDPESTDRDLFDLDGFYFVQGGYFGVVEQAQRIVATLGLLRLDQNVCELRKMYALPELRGQGLGRFLLNAAITKARHWGCSRMVLETASVLTEAVTLYQGYGFRQYHPPEISCRCDMAMTLDLDHAPG